MNTETELRRKLSLFPATNIVVANMIGAGIFTTSGLLMQGLHNPLLMLILWLLGGFVALCGALSYAELGAAIPEAGGEYAFLSSLYHPLLGFLSGWVSLIAGFSAPIAASAIGFSEYAFRSAAISGVTADAVENASGPVLKHAIALLVILLFTGIHTRGIEIGARVQNGLTILKILFIAGLVLAAFLAGDGNWSHLTRGSGMPLAETNVRRIGLSLTWIMFAYSGWNASTYVGSEIRSPKMIIPRSLLLGTAIVAAIYLSVNLFYVFAVDPRSMEGVISIAGLAAGRAFGHQMDSIVSAITAFALFSSLSAYIILGPRVYFAMARDGLFFKTLAEIDPRSQVPSRAILLQGIIACLMVLTGSFDQILTYMGFSLGIFPVLAVAGVFLLRRRDQSVIKLSGYPVLPAVYVILGSVMLTLTLSERPLEAGLAIGTTAMGIPVFFAFRRWSSQSKS